MKNILIKELDQDIASDVIEIICATKMKVTCKIEKGMSNTTVDCILRMHDEDIEFSLYQANNNILFQFENDEDMVNFEVHADKFTDLVIR